MIKSVDHARAVAARRKALGLRGLPRAVVRYMKRTKSAKTWEPSRAIRAEVLSIPYHAPI